ncbi:DNA damage-inducible protein D [Cohnella sp. GCM10020058]|uniref:DNA damage-inducible protein D n=1 Tax=Cohnella sp. GCM10020058 TaxID=3317330 RepID=UPI003624E70C
MEKETNVVIFEEAKFYNDEGEEFWSARDLAKILDYSEYRHFIPVIERARIACENSGQLPQDHFEDFLDMIEIGKGGKRAAESVRLTRYACYLIIQNADPNKEIVAIGQTYFAVQTRRQELMNETDDQKRLMLRDELKKHNSYLASAAKDAGVVTGLEFAIFQNHGYQGLYGGLDSKDIHRKKGLGKSAKILDHMGSTELAANLFRATQTEEKIRRERIRGKDNANSAHLEVGKKVRKAIEDIGGTMPENLPVEEDIKKVERRFNKQIRDNS